MSVVCHLLTIAVNQPDLSPPPASRCRRAVIALIRWFDADFCPEGADKLRAAPDRVDWVRCIPFIVLHVGCLGVLWTGWSPVAIGFAGAFYFVRMFAVTGIYHRYFSHKTYSTSRVGQFLLALWGGTEIGRAHV